MKNLYEKIIGVLKKNWKWLVLIAILLLSFGIRLGTTDTKWLLAYDPYMQFRYTKDFVEDGRLSEWDEFTYYPPGRTMSIIPPFMYYFTGYLFIILNPLLGMTLMIFCKYMAAIFGAVAIIPAYFLGKEFSETSHNIK